MAEVDQVLKEVEEKAARGESWAVRHVAAWSFPTDLEGSLRDMISRWKTYADEHRRRYDSPIGHDGVLGEAWSDIGKGLLALLNGELGRFDGGTLDALIRAIATEHEVDLEK